MTGVSFANRLAEFLKSKKNEEVRDPITVEANPDQSKHLETAKMKLWGIELDLVNLRAEEYAEDSRIPNQIVCNTPLRYTASQSPDSSRQVVVWYPSR